MIGQFLSQWTVQFDPKPSLSGLTKDFYWTDGTYFEFESTDYISNSKRMKSNVRLPSKNEFKFQLESIRVQSDAVHPSFYQPQQGFMSILWSLNRLLEVTVSFYTLNTTVPVVPLVQSTTAPTVQLKKNSTPF